MQYWRIWLIGLALLGLIAGWGFTALAHEELQQVQVQCRDRLGEPRFEGATYLGRELEIEFDLPAEPDDLGRYCVYIRARGREYGEQAPTWRYGFELRHDSDAADLAYKVVFIDSSDERRSYGFPAPPISIEANADESLCRIHIQLQGDTERLNYAVARFVRKDATQD
jgi:hypothetical protein